MTTSATQYTPLQITAMRDYLIQQEVEWLIGPFQFDRQRAIASATRTYGSMCDSAVLRCIGLCKEYITGGADAFLKEYGIMMHTAK